MVKTQKNVKQLITETLLTFLKSIDKTIYEKLENYVISRYSDIEIEYRNYGNFSEDCRELKIKCGFGIFDNFPDVREVSGEITIKSHKIEKEEEISIIIKEDNKKIVDYKLNSKTDNGRKIELILDYIESFDYYIYNEFRKKEYEEEEEFDYNPEYEFEIII